MASRRTERIEGALRDAMLELLKEKPFEKITAKELADRAGVSKSTLYAHYADLHDLVQDCYLNREVYFGQTKKRLRDYDNPAEATCELLDTIANRLVFFRENPNLAKIVLFEVDISPYVSKIAQEEIELSVDSMQTEFGAPVHDFLSIKECAEFIYLGANAMFRDWYRGGMVGDIERLTKCSMYCCFHIHASVAGRPITPERLQAIMDWHYRG